MQAEIISIGEELLSSDSDTLDTNSVYITRQLGRIGVRVLYKTTVGDDEGRITDVLRIALGRADVIITSGGLGPTVDDMTRQGVANATDRGLELHPDLVEDIAQKFARFGVRMSENNRVQAMLPDGAIPMINPVGTAPGFIVEHAGKVILSVPGVPREMKVMVENLVIPFVQARTGAAGVIKTRVVRTAGIGESLIDEQIGHLEKLANPTVGLNAHSGQTDVRITARAASEAEADTLIAPVEAEVRAKLGAHIFGVDREPLEGAFAAAIGAQGVRLALVEIGTEGLLARRLASHPDALTHIDTLDAGMVDALQAAVTPDPDGKIMAERLAAEAMRRTGYPAVMVLFTEPERMAYCIQVGGEARSRGYAYGANAGGTEFIAGWGLASAWYLLSRWRK